MKPLSKPHRAYEAMASSFTGQWAMFDHPSTGRKVCGQIVECHWLGFADPGRVPDMRLKVRGKSGREVFVDIAADRPVIRPNRASLLPYIVS